MYENVVPGTSIHTISATDADDNKRLFYSIHAVTDTASQGLFDINSESGICFYHVYTF